MEKRIFLLLIFNVVLTLISLVTAFVSGSKNKNRQGENEIKSSLKNIEEKISGLVSETESIEKRIINEFSANRKESAENQKFMREETSAALKSMNEELSKMTKSVYEQQIKLNETISQSLNNIRLNNSEQNEKQSRAIQEAIGNMQQNNEKKLEEMRATVDEKLTATLTTRLNSSFETVSKQLENVYKSLGEMKELSNGVTDNVTALNRVLTNVKARGTWAEVQLEGILEQTIPNMFEKNISTTGSSERVEFAVKIPSGESGKEPILLPIDSKFPMEDYIRLCDASDSADIEALNAARKNLEASIKKKAKEITKYINVPKTTPFAIMYLATEGLYAEVASSKTGLSEQLHNEFNIMVAGPSTVTALLNSLSMGFRAVAINEKATEVRTLLAATKKQYGMFGQLLEKARKKVSEAGNVLDEAQKRNDIISNKLKGAESIGFEEADRLLGIETDNGEE